MTTYTIVVIYELAQPIERTQDERFVAIMDRHLPDWPRRRKTLNTLPVRGEDWKL